MKNELPDSFLGKTLEYLNSAEAFLQKNVPAYVEELLTFDFYSALLWMLVPILITALLFLVARKFRQLEEAAIKGRNEEEPYMVGKVLTTTFAIVMIVVSIVNGAQKIETMVKIKVAPRVYLVEKISEQMGQRK